MKISLSGLKLIREYEGLRMNAYADNFGTWTIGYGSVRWADGRLVMEGDKLQNQEEAERLLDYSLQSAIRVVNTHVKVPITQNQFDALVSLVYNIRGRNFNDSGMVELLNGGEYDRAGLVLLQLDDPEICRMTAGCRGIEGLRKRRKREFEIFRLI